MSREYLLLYSLDPGDCIRGGARTDPSPRAGIGKQEGPCWHWVSFSRSSVMHACMRRDSNDNNDKDEVSVADHRSVPGCQGVCHNNSCLIGPVLLCMRRGGNDGDLFSPASLAYTLGSVSVPSLASVYNEFALKKHMDTSVHEQNFFLYFYGACFNLLGVFGVMAFARLSWADVFRGHSLVSAARRRQPAYRATGVRMLRERQRAPGLRGVAF